MMSVRAYYVIFFYFTHLKSITVKLFQKNGMYNWAEKVFIIIFWCRSIIDIKYNPLQQNVSVWIVIAAIKPATVS